MCFIYHFVDQFMLSSNMTVVFHFSLTKTPHFGFYREIYWLQKIEFLKNDHIYLIWVSFVDLNELILNIYIYLFQASIRKISGLLDYYRVPRKIRDGGWEWKIIHIQNQLICFLGSIYPVVKPEMGCLGDHHISVLLNNFIQDKNIYKTVYRT